MSDNMDAPPGAWDDDSPFVPVMPYLDPVTGRPMGAVPRYEMTPEAQARERWPDAAPDRPPDEIRVIGVDEATREVTIVERWNRPPEGWPITIRPRNPADAVLAEAASAVANHMIYGGNAETETTVDTAADMTLDVIDRAIRLVDNNPWAARRAAFLHAAAYGPSWIDADARPDYRSELRAARDRIAELEAEVEQMKRADGWSDNDAPALGGERAEWT